jgi:hypothetical protein
VKMSTRNIPFVVRPFSTRALTSTKFIYEVSKMIKVFLISNFRRVLNVVLFLLGNSPAPEF